MNIRHFVVTPLLVISLLAGSGLSIAADSHSATSSRSATHDPSMMSGQMMNDHMKGGMTMHGCPMMMGQLPPGNEKLAMQMHGEMMKAMGDIMLKYADKFQPAPSK